MPAMPMAFQWVARPLRGDASDSSDNHDQPAQANHRTFQIRTTSSRSLLPSDALSHHGPDHAQHATTVHPPAGHRPRTLHRRRQSWVSRRCRVRGHGRFRRRSADGPVRRRPGPTSHSHFFAQPRQDRRRQRRMARVLTADKPGVVGRADEGRAPTLHRRDCEIDRPAVSPQARCLGGGRVLKPRHPPTRPWHSLNVPLPRALLGRSLAELGFLVPSKLPQGSLEPQHSAPFKRGLQHGSGPVRCAALSNPTIPLPALEAPRSYLRERRAPGADRRLGYLMKYQC